MAPQPRIANEFLCDLGAAELGTVHELNTVMLLLASIPAFVMAAIFWATLTHVKPEVRDSHA